MIFPGIEHESDLGEDIELDRYFAGRLRGQVYITNATTVIDHTSMGIPRSSPHIQPSSRDEV